MAAIDPTPVMLSELSQCAYRLGLAFGGEAERAEDHARRMEYFHLFDRCFFSVRVATALQLRLRRTPDGFGPAERMERGDPREAEPAETERAERGDYDERDRDRERETEPASLPVLLRTLNEIVADAAALPGPPPAALPTLREILAHVAAGSPNARTDDLPAVAPAPKTDLRSRLAGSGAVSALAPPTGSGHALAVRRATGPPRR